MWHWCLLHFSLLTAVLSSDEYEGRVVCYYRSDSVYRAEGYRMQPQEIDPELCTHVIYYSAYLHPYDAIAPSDPQLDLSKGGYKKVVKLKEINPNLKVLLSVRNEPGEKDLWPLISSQKTTRNWFSILVVDFLRFHRFDGLDIDWQLHNGKRNSNNYLYLLKEIRERMEAESIQSKLPKLELSVLLPAQIQLLHRHFLLANMSLYTDFINVATMDYWSLDPYTVQHHAPLYKNDAEGSLSPLNVDESIRYYLFKCVPKEKIVLGVPAYGRAFKLNHGHHFGMGAGCKYPGDKGFASNSPGTLTYFEICTYINEENWFLKNTDKTSMGPYAHFGNKWVGYDDVRMISLKAKYAREKGLGGLMFWSIDQDDFRGYCQHKFALVKAGKIALLTGMIINNVEALKEQENILQKEELEKKYGYFYPKPTIQQPEFTAHEVGRPCVSVPSTLTPPAPAETTPAPATSATTASVPASQPSQETTLRAAPSSEAPAMSSYSPTFPTSSSPIPTKSPETNPTVEVITHSSITETATSEKVTIPTITARPIMPAATTSKPAGTTATPGTKKPLASTTEMDDRINVLNAPPQAPPINLFRPNARPSASASQDNGPSNAVYQLTKVLDTVNQVIADANRINSDATNQSYPIANVSIDPGVLRLIDSLLNFRNSASFTVQQSEGNGPFNRTVQVDSQVGRVPSRNDLQETPSNQIFIPLLNNSITSSDLNASALLGMFPDRGLFISGRDIVSINVNVTINNNYYGRN